MSGEVVVELVGAARLEPVVELLPDRARELVDDLAGVHEVQRADALLREARRLVEEREVGLDLPRRVRPLNFHHDAPSIREDGSVHLADGRGRERGLLELEEQTLDGQTQILLDHALDVRERDRAHVVVRAIWSVLHGRRYIPRMDALGTPRVKPRLRGVSHELAFAASTGLGVALVLTAGGGRSLVSALVFASCVALMFGASALYHRP